MKKPLVAVVKEALKVIDKYEEIIIEVRDIKKDKRTTEVVVRSNGVFYKDNSLHLIEDWKEQVRGCEKTIKWFESPSRSIQRI
jgi:hypothetical protein